MSHMVSGLVISSSWVPFVFSEAKKPMVTAGISRSSMKAIES